MAGCKRIALAAAVGVLGMSRQAEAKRSGVIRAPASMHRDGEAFARTRDAGIVAGRGAGPVAARRAAVLRPSTGYRLPVVAHGSGRHAIRLELGRTGLGREGYRLHV